MNARLPSRQNDMYNLPVIYNFCSLLLDSNTPFIYEFARFAVSV